MAHFDGMEEVRMFAKYIGFREQKHGETENEYKKSLADAATSVGRIVEAGELRAAAGVMGGLDLRQTAELDPLTAIRLMVGPNKI